MYQDKSMWWWFKVDKNITDVMFFWKPVSRSVVANMYLSANTVTDFNSVISQIKKNLIQHRYIPQNFTLLFKILRKLLITSRNLVFMRLFSWRRKRRQLLLELMPIRLFNLSPGLWKQWLNTCNFLATRFCINSLTSDLCS